MQKFKTVEDFMDSLSDDKKAQVEQLRAIIVACGYDLTEHIKWNAPSYVYEGEDRITFNTYNKQDVIKLVLQMGATRKEDKKGASVLQDTTGLIEWSSDIRGMLTFTDVNDINTKKDDVSEIIKQWLALNI